MIQQVQLITGGSVTGYGTSISEIFGYPVLDINDSGTFTIPALITSSAITVNADGTVTDMGQACVNSWTISTQYAP